MNPRVGRELGKDGTLQKIIYLSQYREARAILATKHDRTPDGTLAATLVDADLAILGAASDVYDRYAADIRAEWSHVPEDAYRAGRADILEGFLARDRVFHTDAGRAAWVGRARDNLTREIRTLRGGD